MISDPGHGQIGQHLLGLAKVLQGDAVGRGSDDVGEAQHHAFRLTRGARGVKDDRGVRAPPLVHPGLEEARVGRTERAASFLHGLEIDEQGRVVMAQAARIGVDDRLEVRAARHDFEQLIDLLLVLGHGEADPGVIDHVGHLLGHRVLIDRHRHGADRLGRHQGPIESRPIVADDGDLVAPAKAESGQAASQGLHLAQDLAPAPGLPDAIVLLAHRRPRSSRLGVMNQ